MTSRPKILIGTSGYYYNDWAETVYPKELKKTDYLAYYSGIFSTVELNSTFYGMPTPEGMTKKLLEAGENTTFSVKATKTMTHEIDHAQWRNEAETFIKALYPLRQAKRLDAVLFQFPYSFHYSTGNRIYLDNLLKFFTEIPAAVEFRTSEWYATKVIQGMQKRGVSLVSLDMPNLPKLPPSMDVVTAPLAYIRLHGRNKENWWASNDHARYNYQYSDRELNAWADRIGRLSQKAERVLVYFNNHPNGQAVINARLLRVLLANNGIIKRGGKEMENGEEGNMPS